MISLLAIIMGAGAAAVDPASPACPAALPFPDGLRVINAVRVVKGANGESDFVDTKVPATLHAYFKPGELFGAIDLGAAKRVQIVSGPPNVKLPLHVSPGYEMFLTIQGSSSVILPDGRRREARPGTLVIMDDIGSKTGHAGETGPCGYVAVQIVPTAALALP